jgi:sRNA-binding carbon storage regulator CsrA
MEGLMYIIRRNLNEQIEIGENINIFVSALDKDEVGLIVAIDKQFEVGEVVSVGNVKIKVVKTSSNRVELAIDAPDTVKIRRLPNAKDSKR